MSIISIPHIGKLKRINKSKSEVKEKNIYKPGLLCNPGT